MTSLKTFAALHDSIKRALKLLGVSIVEFEYETPDHCSLKRHPVLCPYVTDILETKDLLALKRGIQTRPPCHRCTTSSHELSESTKATKRTPSLKKEYHFGIFEYC